MKNRVRIGSMAAASLLAVSAANVNAAPPVTKRFTGTLITPADAWTYYGSATTHTNGIASNSTRAPEIRALARSLSRDGGLTGDAFIQRVADYVHKNIETEFLFGLGKGARGAAIDQSGTVFDQAQLMVEILRERGQAASYQLGTISLTADQFGKWTGHVNSLNQASQTFTVDAKSVCQMLADGGIPAIVNGAASCASLTAGTALSSVTMAHLWVLANGKAYDPGFKAHILKAGIDIPAAMGCGNVASPTCGTSLETQALTGATQGTAYSASYVQNINQVAVENYVQARAVALQGALQSNPTQSIEDAVGGTVIDLKQSVSSGTSLPYQASTQASWSGDVPDQFRTAFQVQFMGLNSTLYADEIAGNRIRLVTTAPADSFTRTSTLLVDGANVAQASAQGTPAQVDRPTLSVNHPFGASSGTYADDSAQVTFAIDQRNSNACYVYSGPGYSYTQCNIGFNGLYTLYLDVGAAGQGREQHFNKLMIDSKEGALVAEAGFDRRTNAPPTAAKHAVQTSEAISLVGNLSKTFVNQMHSLGGLYSQDRAGDGRLNFNLSTGLSSASRTSMAADADAAFASAAAASAALEGSAFQQSEDAYESGASVSMFKLANAKGLRFYLANMSNVSSVLGGVTNYTTARKNLLSGYANTSASSNVIIPSSGFIGSVSLGTNAGSIDFSITPELYYDSTGVGYLVNEMYKGGGSVAMADPPKDALATARAESNSVKDKKYFGIDLASGVINLTPAPDLTVGSGVGTLAFQRKYSSGSAAGLRCNTVVDNPSAYSWHYSCGPTNQQSYGLIQGGWDHNLNVTASWSGNGSEGLGQTSGLRASRAIVALYGLIDTNRSTTFQRRMTSIFVTLSLMDSFVRNTVTTSVAGQFVRLPDGSFDPPPESRAARLTLAGAPSTPFIMLDTSSVTRDYSATQFDLTLGDGAQWTFKSSEGVSSVVGQNYSYGQNADNMSVYAPTFATSSIGLKQTYNYTIVADNSGTTKKVVSSVSNSTGNALTLSHSNPGVFPYPFYGYMLLNSVSDGLGRSAGFACASDDPGAPFPQYWLAVGYMEQCGITVTDSASGVSKYRLIPGTGNHPNFAYPDRVLKEWFTPSNSSTPFITLSYDPVLHISSYQDIAGRTTKVFVSNIAGDRYRIGELQDPLGAVASSIFDKDGSVLQTTDPIGRATRNLYDDARHVLRTVFPEGNAVEYSYDIRGNRLTECQIAKGRVTWANLTTLTERTPQCSAGAGDLVTSTTYMEGPTVRADQCANMKTCNKPSYVIDPRNNRTDYTWDATHGQLLTETQPADNAGVRPVTTLGYTAYSTGDGATFYLMTSKTEKISASASTTTTYEYDASNRYALKSSIVDSGGLALRTCYKFDATGNVVSQTTPRGAAGGCP